MWLAAAVDGVALPPAAAAQSQTYPIDLPAGPLPASLAALSRQTGASIGIDGALPAMQVRALKGRLTIERALERILDSSGLRAVRIGPAAFRLERKQATRRKPVPPPAVSQAPEAPQSELIVTALKRAQSLDNVPLSLAVVRLRATDTSGALMDSAAVASRIDGLTITSLGAGRNRQFIRGVADSPFSGRSQSTVSVNLDEARVTYNAPDPDLRLVDIDRVEILKGPQGPLYGTGALGGVYRIVTNRPDLGDASFAATVQGSGVQHGDVGGGLTAIVNLPLIRDRLAIRAVGYGTEEPGWIDNADGPRNSNDTHVRGGRLALRWKPSDWTVDLAAAGQFQTVDDSRYVTTGMKTLSRSGIAPEPHENDFLTASATVTGPLGALDLLATANWVDHDIASTMDASAAAPLFGLADSQLYFDERHYRLFNQEVRLSSKASQYFSWLAGLSYLSAMSRINGRIGPEAATSTAIETARQQVDELAAFGEVSLALFPAITATAGLRAFYSHIADERRGVPEAQQLRTKKTGLTPSLSLAWQPATGQNYYLHYAGALRPGGLSPASNGLDSRFQSDELSNFELGGRWVLGRVTLESGAYLTFWDHIQSDYLLPNGIVGTRNAGDGRIAGVEAALRWAPSSLWSIESGLTLQDARIVHPEGSVALAEDRRLPVVPGLAGRAAVARHLSLGAWSGTIEARMNYTGMSRLSFDADLDRRMGNYAIVGLSAAVARGAWHGRLGLDNVLNARGDSFAFGNPFTIRNGPQYSPLRPRMLSVSIGRTF